MVINSDVNRWQSIESDVRSYCRSYDAVFTRAKDCYVYDRDGNRYLDFLCGCGSLNYGHNNEVLKEALVNYIQDDGITMSMDLYTEAKKEFLINFKTNILDKRNLKYRMQFSGPSGANAIEAAIKLARKATGRSNIVAFTNGFHGCSLGALSLTANSHHRASSTALLSQVSRFPYDGYFGDQICTSKVFSRLIEDPSSGIDLPAAIVIELVQGEGGLNVASYNWLEAVVKICRKKGILIIVDDIQVGCGRTGSFFSFEEMEITPDIVTLAKSISGFGLPMSLVLIKPELDCWIPGEHNGTFRGNNHAFITAKASIDHFWSDDTFSTEVKKKGVVIGNAINKISRNFDLVAKGKGMIVGIDLLCHKLAGEVKNRCFSNGLLLETCGPEDTVIKLLPPLTIGYEKLDDGLSIVKDSINKEISKTR